MTQGYDRQIRGDAHRAVLPFSASYKNHLGKILGIADGDRPHGHPPGQFICKKCGARFASPRALGVHMRAENPALAESRPERCGYCGVRTWGNKPHAPGCPDAALTSRATRKRKRRRSQWRARHATPARRRDVIIC